MIIIEPPLEPPITLEDARHQCRIDGSEEDALLEAAIAAAVAYVEGETGTLLMTQTVRFTVADPAALWRLGFGPVQSVASIGYIDAAGLQQAVEPASFALRGLGSIYPEIALLDGFSWPARQAGSELTVTVVAGYGSGPENVPAPVRWAIRLLVGQWYENRGALIVGTTQAKMDNGVAALLRAHSRRGG